jgi:hypothetical protein
MRRVLAILGLVFAAGAGAYGQSLMKAEKPSLDAIQVGALYNASFCGGTGSFGVRFDMRVTKLLNDHWFEAEYGNFRKDVGAFQDYGSGVETGRFNQAVLCFVKPILP